MNVRVLMNDFKIVEKSGVGRAILHQIETLKRAGVSITNRNAQIIHVNTILPSSFFAALFARLRGKNVVYYGHSTEEDFRNSFVGSNLFSSAFKMWLKACYSLGNVILTPTEYSAKLLKAYGFKQPIYNISNGVDTDFFKQNAEQGENFRKRYGFSSSDKVIISVGHLIERKGIIDFIDLAKSMPNTTFMWFGSTPSNMITSNVKHAIKNAPKNVIFAGYVSREDLRDAYCGADLFAFMSHEETEGIVVLEALACKIPMVVRDIPVYSSWLTDKKDVYKATSLTSFKETSENILNKTATNLTTAGYLVAQSRSIMQIGKNLLSIYKKEFAIS